MASKRTPSRASKKRDPSAFTARPLPGGSGRGRPRTVPSLPFAVTRLAGDRIAAARAAREWTQQELAQRAGLSQHLISLYETNMRVALFPSVVKLAEVLGVSIDYLAARSSDPTLH